MERCDLYDENRNPLGRTKGRKEALAPGEYKVAVGLWIFNKNGEILLTQRSPQKSFMPNAWENTSGHVAAGETSLEAAVRELEEETGIQAAPEALRYLGTAKVPPYFGDNYALIWDRPAGVVRLREGETVDAQWVPYPRFLEMARLGMIGSAVISHLAHYQDAFLQAMADARNG